MTPRPRQKLVWIEVARGIAATLVILHHVSQHLSQELGYVPFRRALEPGSAAVDFFFVLSGFLILHVTQKDIGNPQTIVRYLRKRVLRIYPIFWAALLVFIAMNIIRSNSPVALSPAAIVLEGSLWPVTSGEPRIVGVAWSLSYEIFFYLLFAALLLHRGFGRAVFALWTLAALLVSTGALATPSNSALELITSEYSLLFPLGMAVAVGMRRASHPGSRSVLIIALPALAVTWYLQSAGHLEPHGTLPRLTYGVFSAMALYGLVLRDQEGKSVSWRPLLVLGECSYSIYLFHLVGVGIAAKAISVLGLYGEVPAFLLAAVMIVAGLIVGVAAGLIIERPLVRWARRVA